MQKHYTLTEAYEVFGFKVSTLRTERRNGNLTCIKIAGKLFVTEQAIQEMLMKCQEKENSPASTSERPAKRIVRPHGSSSTQGEKQALDAAKATLKALKSRSPNTSRKNGQQAATIVPMRSQ